jgi:micrococcal nuclease
VKRIYRTTAFALLLTVYISALTSAPAAAGVSHIVKRIVDGDTIVLDDMRKVRLIGVDTTESVDPGDPTEYFSREAAEFTRKTCEGKRVRLEYDRQRTDIFGRTLAYVFVLEAGKEIFLNAEIIKQGYGFAYLKYPFRRDYMEAFAGYERQAEEKGVGLWGGGGARAGYPLEGDQPAVKKPPSEKITVFVTKSGTKYHRDGCRHLGSTKIPLTLGEAARRGYDPCAVCAPPALNDRSLHTN